MVTLRRCRVLGGWRLGDGTRSTTSVVSGSKYASTSFCGTRITHEVQLDLGEAGCDVDNGRR